MGERMTANEDGTFTVHVHGPVADKMIALLTENADLREALAKSASREAALVEKLKVAEDALDAAASSLRSINRLAGIDEYMLSVEDVRGYARNRALTAYEAIAKIKEAS